MKSDPRRFSPALLFAVVAAAATPAIAQPSARPEREAAREASAASGQPASGAPGAAGGPGAAGEARLPKEAPGGAEAKRGAPEPAKEAPAGPAGPAGPRAEKKSGSGTAAGIAASAVGLVGLAGFGLTYVWLEHIRADRLAELPKSCDPNAVPKPECGSDGDRAKAAMLNERAMEERTAPAVLNVISGIVGFAGVGVGMYFALTSPSYTNKKPAVVSVRAAAIPGQGAAAVVIGRF
jgi:hypothetical protein